MSEFTNLYYPQDEFTLSCNVCNNSDYTRFDYNGQTNQCTCTECGAVLDRMGFADLFACSLGPIDGIVSIPNDLQRQTPDYKGTYHRRAYFSERLSAACLLDPDVPPDDKLKIREEYNQYSNKNWIQESRCRKGIIDKKDIQIILRSLNKKNNTNRFTTCYLEKWKSLKAYLGGKVKVYTAEQLARVGSRLMHYSSQWDFDQPPSNKKDRNLWKFKHRKDFPSFNYMIRLIHKELGIKGLDQDFAIPTTTNSLKQLKTFAVHLEPTLEPKLKQLSIANFLTESNK